MLPKLALGAPAIVFTACVAIAEPVTLKAPEIEALLSGNTTIGLWSGTSYRQYYDPNGRTIYVSERGSPEHGKWRVNQETNKYESQWERSGWSAYGIARDGEKLLWSKSDGDSQVFTVMPGNRLSQ